MNLNKVMIPQVDVSISSQALCKKWMINTFRQGCPPYSTPKKDDFDSQKRSFNPMDAMTNTTHE
jgi:hypothetical protein